MVRTTTAPDRLDGSSFNTDNQEHLPSSFNAFKDEVYARLTALEHRASWTEQEAAKIKQDLEKQTDNTRKHNEIATASPIDTDLTTAATAQPSARELELEAKLAAKTKALATLTTAHKTLQNRMRDVRDSLKEWQKYAGTLDAKAGASTKTPRSMAPVIAAGWPGPVSKDLRSVSDILKADEQLAKEIEMQDTDMPDTIDLEGRAFAVDTPVRAVRVDGTVLSSPVEVLEREVTNTTTQPVVDLAANPAVSTDAAQTNNTSPRSYEPKSANEPNLSDIVRLTVTPSSVSISDPLPQERSYANKLLADQFKLMQNVQEKEEAQRRILREQLATDLPAGIAPPTRAPALGTKAMQILQEQMAELDKQRAQLLAIAHAAPNPQNRPPVLALPKSYADKAAQDYNMQLMLLEHQNKNKHLAEKHKSAGQSGKSPAALAQHKTSPATSLGESSTSKNSNMVPLELAKIISAQGNGDVVMMAGSVDAAPGPLASYARNLSELSKLQSKLNAAKAQDEQRAAKGLAPTSRPVVNFLHQEIEKIIQQIMGNERKEEAATSAQEGHLTQAQAELEWSRKFEAETLANLERHRKRRADEKAAASSAANNAMSTEKTITTMNATTNEKEKEQNNNDNPIKRIKVEAMDIPGPVQVAKTAATVLSSIAPNPLSMQGRVPDAPIDTFARAVRIGGLPANMTTPAKSTEAPLTTTPTEYAASTDRLIRPHLTDEFMQRFARPSVTKPRTRQLTPPGYWNVDMPRSSQSQEDGA